MHLKKILNLCLFGFTTELSIVPLAFANDVYAEGPLPTVVDIATASVQIFLRAQALLS